MFELQERAEIMDMVNQTGTEDAEVRSEIHCWGLTCNKSKDMEGADPPYGFICKLCGKSLRQHPFFGQYKEYDRGNPNSIIAWNNLTRLEKTNVYIKYGFSPKGGEK